MLHPMHTPTLYLDTSVVGGYFDDEWKDATQELWRQMEQGKYRFLTSDVTMDEMTKAPKRVQDLLEKTFLEAAILSVTEESEQLAAAYMSRNILPPQIHRRRPPCGRLHRRPNRIPRKLEFQTPRQRGAGKGIQRRESLARIPNHPYC